MSSRDEIHVKRLRMTNDQLQHAVARAEAAVAGYPEAVRIAVENYITTGVYSVVVPPWVEKSQ